MKDHIDIYSKGEYPSGALSNFYPHAFTFDGVECASMEGLLQSLKTRDAERQSRICKMHGKDAKLVFYKKPQDLLWRLSGKLFWRGRAMCRYGDEYQHFLDRAYLELSKNEGFCDALRASCGSTLSHSIGKTNTKKTILTEYEFISRIEKCRERVCGVRDED